MQARTPRWIPTEPSKLTLMGIRFLAPPDDDPAGGGGGGTPPAPTPPAPTPTPPAPTPPAPQPAPVPAPQPVAYDADYAHRLREEAKASRERAEKAEAERDAHVKTIAERDAAIAARDKADAERQHTQTLRDLGVKPEIAADVDAVLDSQAWATAAKDLDWSKPADVEAALSKFVTDHPRFKTAPKGPGSSGPIRPGGPAAPPRRGGLLGALDAAVASGA